MDAVTAAFPPLAEAAGWQAMDWHARRASSGLRPTTPDSLPILDSLVASGWGNVYVNAGHGTMGWTLSMGSAEVLAALALGQPGTSPVDPAPFALKRFRWGRVLGKNKTTQKKVEAEEGRAVAAARAA